MIHGLFPGRQPMRGSQGPALGLGTGDKLGIAFGYLRWPLCRPKRVELSLRARSRSFRRGEWTDRARRAGRARMVRRVRGGRPADLIGWAGLGYAGYRSTRRYAAVGLRA